MKPYQHNSGPGVVIGVPTLGRPIPIEWAFALKSMNPPTNFNTIFHVIKGRPIDEARNEFAQLAIEKDAKYLFMLGDDVVIPNHALRQLIYRLEQDSSIGVVGGIYCAKNIPAEPLVYRGNGKGCYWDWKVGEFFEITGIGMDCTLIRTDLLRKLGKDWFTTISKDDYLDAVNNTENWTEDLSFCHKVLTQTDYKIYADAMVLCEHWDIHTGNIYKLPIGSPPMRRAEVDIEKKQALYIKHPTDDFKVVIDDPNFQVTTYGPESTDYRGTTGILPFENEQFTWVVACEPAFRTTIDEYLRICKPGGKITIKYHPLMDYALIQMKIVNSTINGDFIEVVKNGA